MGRPNKLKIALTRIEESVIMGSLLGDGSMGVYGTSINPRLFVGNSIKQAEWVIFKFDMLKNLCKMTEPKLNKGKKYSTLYFQTRSFEDFMFIYNMFYSKGIKRVPNNIADYLDALALAVWFGDDGSKSIHNPSFKNRRKTVLELGKIHVCSFSELDCNILAEALLNNFNIKSNITFQNKGKGYRQLYIPSSEFKKLSDIISSYLPSSMQYKLVQDTLATTMYESAVKSSTRDSLNLCESARGELKCSPASYLKNVVGQ